MNRKQEQDTDAVMQPRVVYLERQLRYRFDLIRVAEVQHTGKRKEHYSRTTELHARDSHHLTATTLNRKPKTQNPKPLSR